MLTCKEASQLASKSMDSKLTWREQLGLSFHIAMCGLCRRYVRDMKKLRSLLRRKRQTGSVLLPESVTLSKQSKARIKQVLDKSLQHEGDDRV